MKLSFTKMHGAGNDFVVIDATRERFRPTPELLARLSDRRYGVGCDQVLVIESPSSPGIDFDYRIFNADGSEVGQCGNGTRALARFVAEHGLSDKRRLRVQTSTATMELQRLDDGQVRVDMGAPRWTPGQIPLALPAADRYRIDTSFGAIEFGAVSVGNPHALIRVDDVDTAPVEVLGRELQSRRDVFPESVNVGFLQIVDAQLGRLRVWERGSGETLACGSGACAAAAVGHRWGGFGERVKLQLRGGELMLEWSGSEQASIFMTGPAETVFNGEIEWQQ
ncbi:MAG: diaminopimelate epimerase [Hydrocarboniphaga sp.]|uniref:diaminopimelate epimerase n=1 Tax=Hydrocarboniphaga sp. TaxID=2033016 RepID=UPI002630C8EE|nr:diaminopimelate epimerase [Hydrocarboniphaga sp.]MDB5969261.1 diaminopimelate epimerase [Hydrocarboniphaga sp.]